MIYGSVCSGIEAATVAWHPLGWRPAFFAEIEPFPCAVLSTYYPTAPNYGDMTKFKEWPDAAIDVLVGGTPCQSFSVAGLRKGLDDPRGNLTLTYLAVAHKYRPKWLVWENVPGVLSDATGAFGAFLRGLGELGYGFAYRILDAQYFGVPQRRRRVFVVGCLGDWRRAAAVLFERHSLQGNPAPSREARERVAGGAAPGATGGGIPPVCGTLNHSGGHAVPGNCAQDWNAGMLIPQVANPLTARMHKGINTTCDEGQTMIAHALRAEGFDASEDGTGRGTPLVPVAFSRQAGGTQTTLGYDPESGTAPTLNKSQTAAVAVDVYNQAIDGDIAGTLNAESGAPNHSGPKVMSGMQVRRLTPRECERLQGFPDDYTLVEYRKKPAADGPRYKALGNSMAVPVMAWIGRRIAAVEEIR